MKTLGQWWWERKQETLLARVHFGVTRRPFESRRSLTRRCVDKLNANTVRKFDDMARAAGVIE